MDGVKVKIVYYSGDYYRVLYRFERKKNIIEHIFGEQYEVVKYFFSAGYDCQYGVFDKLFRIHDAEDFAKQITPEFIAERKKRIESERESFLTKRAAYLSKNRPYKIKNI